MIYDYYKQFPDIHPNIILKAELNRRGVDFTKEAIEAFKRRDDLHWKGYHVFSYDVQDPVFYGAKIPSDFFLEDGSAVYERTNRNSPYSIDFRDGRFVVIENNEIIADNLTFAPKPKYYDMQLEDGTKLPAIVNSFGNELMFITFNKYCEFWNTHDECMFCDINTQLRKQAKSEEDVVARKDPAVITEVVKTVRTLDPHLNIVVMSGGTILTKYQGQTEIEFYCRRLEAVREGLGGTWLPASVQIVAHDDEEWKRLYETGVASIHANMEVWDERLFNWICPGKAKFIGRDEWIKRMIRGVDFFGWGKINPNFVLGVEMAKPHGFEDVSSAVKSTAEGWDFLMSHGVLPRHAYWTIEPDSAFRDQQIPPLEYFLEVEKAYTELRWKHGLDPPFPAGNTRTSYFLSCLQDFEYYHGSGPMSKKKIEARGGSGDLKVGDRGFVA